MKRSSPSPPSPAHQPVFATTTDVLELIVEAVALPHVASLLRMRAVSRAWRAAVHNGVRRMAMHPAESWSTASTLSDFAAATPLVARAAVVAGGGAWLRMLPDEAWANIGFDVAVRCLPRVTAVTLRPPRGCTRGPAATAVLNRQVRSLVGGRIKSSDSSTTATTATPPPLLPQLQQLTVDVTLSGNAADPREFLGPLLTSATANAATGALEDVTLLMAGDHPLLGAALAPARAAAVAPSPSLSSVTRITIDLEGSSVLPTTAQGLHALAHGVPGGLRRLAYKRRSIVAKDPGLMCVINASPRLEEFALVHVRSRDVSHLSALAATCPNLRKLRLEWCPTETAGGLRAVALACRSLEELTIIQLHGDDAGDAVAECVTSCEALHSLTVVEIELSAANASSIARHGRRLRRLHVSACGQHSTALLLDVARASSCGVEELTVDGIHATDELLAALGAHCATLRALTTLARLGNALVTDAGVQALTESMGIRESLRHLSIANHRGGVTDKGHSLVARRCQRLEHYAADSGCFPFHHATTIDGALRAFADHGSAFLRHLQLDYDNNNGHDDGAASDVVGRLRARCPVLGRR